MKRYFVTEPWGWGDTFGFATIEETKTFCDKEGIDYDYIEDLGQYFC